MTATRRRVADRRERNRQLAVEDAKHRCGHCKIALPKTGVKMRWNDPAMYCSDDCLEASEQRAAGDRTR